MGGSGHEGRATGLCDGAKCREQADECGLPWSGVDGGAEQMRWAGGVGGVGGSRYQIHFSDHHEEESSEK